MSARLAAALAERALRRAAVFSNESPTKWVSFEMYYQAAGRGMVVMPWTSPVAAST